ncbi:retrotransposon protein, putative, ty1-copia subclass [Tanacetum coccineum]|uniref:Retrotransposon protein, putative, ty1-copia subclass n=1 Tax=Tanacetum coccineum TaxID=301880 RepID=A0ABQ5GL00_9ASTR
MEHGFLSQKGSRGGRGEKEKNTVVAAKDVVSPSMIDEPVVEEKQSSLVDTSIPNFEKIGLSLYPPLPTQGSSPAGNTPDMSSYANVTSAPIVPVESISAINERIANTAYRFFLGKRVAYPVVANYGNPDVNLWKKDVGNVLVWVKLHGVPVTAFSENGLSAIATKLGNPLMLESYTSNMCLQSWGMSSYARAMIELQADVKLKDTIVVDMPKLTGRGFIREEYPKNPSLGVAKSSKKPSQAPSGVSVRPKVGFKPVKEYRPVSKKPTANTSGNKKKGVESTKEVSNSNPFGVLNSVKNDGELGIKGGTSNLASKGANYSDSSFWNVETSSTSTIPIVDKIEKLEKLIIGGNVTLVDDEVDNDMARSMASKMVGFGTKNLLEQWRNSYENDDYDEDPYDDDMYEGHDIPDKIQDICDNLDIRVRVVAKSSVIILIIIDGKFTLVDDESKPQEKVDSSSDHDSEDEVASVHNKMASFLASKTVGYGTNSLLEQWKETYENADYDYEPYDDDVYEGQDVPDKIHSICDNLDIKDELNSVPIWVKFHDILIAAFTADGFSVMATKLELKKDMIIVIPNVEDDGEALHTIKVDVCMVFEHDDMLCPKQRVEKPKKQHTNHDGFQHTYSSHGTHMGSKVQFTPQKPIWQAVFKMNSASSSGTKKNSKVSIKVTSSNNPFNALNTIEDDDELGSNRGSSNSGKKVVQYVAGSA